MRELFPEQVCEHGVSRAYTPPAPYTVTCGLVTCGVAYRILGWRVSCGDGSRL